MILNAHPSEAVVSIPGFGIQICSNFYSGRSEATFLDASSICSIVINEGLVKQVSLFHRGPYAQASGILPLGVIYYIAVICHGSDQLHVMFPVSCRS